ncbi:hypothetical protein HY374_03090 [Candidatus Berkelbacteria bacterium]|nr:hypothetical protein [Candidatus Berkelbacteria bacterium]
MNYGALINRAWQLAVKHRFLWVLGIFGGGASSMPAVDPSPLIDLMENEGNTGTLASWLSLPWETVHAQTGQVSAADAAFGSGLIVFMLFLVLGLIYLSITFRGGLIAAARELDRGSGISFGEAWRAGRHAFWRLLGLGVLMLALVLLVTVVFAAPVLALTLLDTPAPAIILGALLGLLWFAFVILVSVGAEYAVRGLVLHELGVVASIRHGFDVLRRNPAPAFLLWLISLALGIGLGLAYTVALGLLLVPLGAIGWGFYALGVTALTVLYAVVAGIVLIAALFAAGGFVNAFISMFWTLGYLELAPTQK